MGTEPEAGSDLSDLALSPSAYKHGHFSEANLILGKESNISFAREPFIISV